jgi:hypothetical protein
MAFDMDVIKLFGAEYYYPCEVDQAMKDTGWVGGQWVKFTGMTTVADGGNNYRIRRYVEKSDPDHPVFFMLRGSYEAIDQYTGIYPGRTGVVSCGVYGQYLFKYYETDDLAERTTPGTGSPLVYSVNGDLYVSDRGLLTTEAETANARTVGICIGLPADNNNYLPVFIGY